MFPKELLLALHPHLTLSLSSLQEAWALFLPVSQLSTATMTECLKSPCRLYSPMLAPMRRVLLLPVQPLELSLGLLLLLSTLQMVPCFQMVQSSLPSPVNHQVTVLLISFPRLRMDLLQARTLSGLFLQAQPLYRPLPGPMSS